MVLIVHIDWLTTSVSHTRTYALTHTSISMCASLLWFAQEQQTHVLAKNIHTCTLALRLTQFSLSLITSDLTPSSEPSGKSWERKGWNGDGMERKRRELGDGWGRLEVKGKWWETDDNVAGQGDNKSREGWETKPLWWRAGEWQDRGESDRGVRLQGAMAVPSVGQPVIVLRIDRVLSGKLLALLNSWSGRVEYYHRKQGWVTFRKRDRQGTGREREKERIKRTWVWCVQFSDFTSQIFAKVPDESLNVTAKEHFMAFLKSL